MVRVGERQVLAFSNSKEIGSSSILVLLGTGFHLCFFSSSLKPCVCGQGTGSTGILAGLPAL